MYDAVRIPVTTTTEVNGRVRSLPQCPTATKVDRKERPPASTPKPQAGRVGGRWLACSSEVVAGRRGEVGEAPELVGLDGEGSVPFL